MRGDADLGEREQEILTTVVRLFVATGSPVGSKAVAACFSESLSPATIRNAMAELEAAGYLTQPHTSAGRIPGDKAYRAYVDRASRAFPLPPATEKYIDSALGAEARPVNELMVQISLVLSEVSNNLGVVLGPALEEKLLEHIKFVRLPDERVLAVIVSRPDLIENRIFCLQDACSQAELDQAADFLNQEFRGWSLRTIRLELVKRLEEMREASDRLLTNVAKLFMWGALAQPEPGPLFVGGTARIIAQPDFVDAGKVKELLAAIEEKAKVINVLRACLDAHQGGVQALIGRENPNFEMWECSFILAPFHYRRRPVGALGVIGPTRMEYDRAMGTVEYIAQVASRLLSAN